MNPPRVTVLMSVHNGGRWLRAAIDSVLAQTWRDFEFLILDDASTDDSVVQINAVEDLRVRLIRLPENIGLTRSLNCGLHAARGEIIARQDSDDLVAEQRISVDTRRFRTFRGDHQIHQAISQCRQRIEARADAEVEFDLRMFRPVGIQRRYQPIETRMTFEAEQ